MDLGSGVFPTRNKTYYVVAIAGYSRTHLVKNYEEKTRRDLDSNCMDNAAAFNIYI